MPGFELPMGAIRDQIAAALDIIVHVDRMPDGRRVVTSVAEVQGLEGDVFLLQAVFVSRPARGIGSKTGDLVPTGLRPKFMDKLGLKGIEIPARSFQPPSTQTGA